MNSSWNENSIREWKNVDVSVAVSTGDGLITPIVYDADKKSIGTISSEIKNLALKAREGSLQPKDFQVKCLFTIIAIKRNRSL